MDVNQLSDGDLRRALLAEGIEVGPVTNTTRSVYRKKLAKVTSQDGKKATKTEIRQEYVQETVRVSQQEEVRSESCQTPTPVDFKRFKTLQSTPRPVSSDSDSPYRYAHHDFPSDENLRRRALYTPGGRVRTANTPTLNKKVEKGTYLSGRDAVDAAAKKTSFPWTSILMAVIVLIVLLILLIYYHMEPNEKDMLAADGSN